MTITKSAENVPCEPPPDPYSHLMVDFSQCARLPIHLLVNCSGRGRGTSSRVHLKSRRDASFPQRLLASQMVLWYRRAVQEPERPSRPPCVKHETTPKPRFASTTSVIWSLIAVLRLSLSVPRINWLISSLRLWIKVRFFPHATGFLVDDMSCRTARHALQFLHVVW